MNTATTTDSRVHNRLQAKIAREEAELKALLEGNASETDEEEEQSESEESASERVEAEPTVSPKDNTKQEKATEAEAQEDDTKLSAEERTFKQRYGDLRKHQLAKEAEFKEELGKLKLQLEKATKNELVLPKTSEEVEAWAKKYPDVAAIVEAIADKKASERASDLDVRLQEIESMRVQAKKEKAEAELLGYHPDFVEIREDDAFHEWAETQPKWVQDALYENTDDAKSVARVIDLYKVDAGIKTAKKASSDKSAASSVKTRSTTKPEADQASKYLSESQVAKMSMKEYEKRQEEIFEAQRTGKFIYDMSKK
ncbi:MAG: hypothetical protein EBZ21_08345 [Flavobacteriia bacterium]|nr:hypothetical protein [Flavobacteriia bacterium]